MKTLHSSSILAVLVACVTASCKTTDYLRHLSLNGSHLIEFGRGQIVLVNPMALNLQVSVVELGDVGFWIYDTVGDKTRCTYRENTASADRILFDEVISRIQRVESDVSSLSSATDSYYSIQYPLSPGQPSLPLAAQVLLSSKRLRQIQLDDSQTLVFDEDTGEHARHQFSSSETSLAGWVISIGDVEINVPEEEGYGLQPRITLATPELLNDRHNYLKRVRAAARKTENRLLAMQLATILAKGLIPTELGRVVGHGSMRERRRPDIHSQCLRLASSVYA